MKTSLRSIFLFCAVLVSVLPASAQQVKNTGTEQVMPDKTVILRDPGSEQASTFLGGAQILRFGVYKAGSTNDVGKMLRSFTGTEGIKKVTEGPVSGDVKEFVIELNSPRDVEWYRSLFTKAGIKYIKLNTAEVKPISEL